ncbi:MAG TPA: DM13 domain-containing protein [Actinomycetota bacterium]|nr:DM13 domain-containing protein [Actinomycetota bacterium]
MVAGRRRTRVLLLGLVVAVVAAGGAVAWFQPQKLLIDQRVDEALPGQAAPSQGPAATPAPSGGPATVATGRFRSLGHTTSGRVAVLEVDGGRRYLRLDDLATSNGPDLFVYLSAAPADGPRDRFDDEFLSLGRLKANQGNQNYEIAAGTRLGRYRSVVIWCRRFTYAFGAAELDPAR